MIFKAFHDQDIFLVKLIFTFIIAKQSDILSDYEIKPLQPGNELCETNLIRLHRRADYLAETWLKWQSVRDAFSIFCKVEFQFFQFLFNKSRHKALVSETQSNIACVACRKEIFRAFKINGILNWWHKVNKADSVTLSLRYPLWLSFFNTLSRSNTSKSLQPC